MDDASLVRMAIMGREQAVVELYRKYVGPIYKFFYWQTNRSRELAEDLTSQTFLEMVRSIKNFEGKSSFSGYLYGIAKKELMDHIRRKYKEPFLPLFESLSINEEIFDEDKLKEKIELIEKLFDKLSPRERTALEMRYLEGASSAEIADKLGTSVSNAKVIVHRTIKKLAKQKL